MENSVLMHKIKALFVQSAECGYPDQVYLSDKDILSPRRKDTPKGSTSKDAEHRISFEKSTLTLLKQEERIPLFKPEVSEKSVSLLLPTVSYEQKRTQLIELYQRMKICRQCSLGYNAGGMVFGSGNASAPLMVIGDSPDEIDCRNRKPFAGQYSELLSKMLSSIQLDREKDVFCTTIVKCRVPEGASPLKDQIEYCMDSLICQINIIQPLALLVFGEQVVAALRCQRTDLAQIQGQSAYFRGIRLFAVHSLAQLNSSTAFKKSAWTELQLLQKFFLQKGIYNAKKNAENIG